MLVGRDAALGRASGVLAAGHALVVTGEAGVGKTALLDAALAGARVHAGQCFRSLAGAAGLPLQQAVGRPVPAEDAGHTAQWLVTACRGGVLRLDDLQWADALTLQTLSLLPSAVQVVASVRTGDDGTEAALQTLARLGADVLALEPLAEDDAAELARQAHPRLHPEQARELARRSGGNPLLVVELDAASEPSTGLRRTVVSRLRRHGPGVWQGFAMLAVAGEPLPGGWLPDTAGLLACGLVVAAGDGTVVARHPLLAEMAAAELADRPDERAQAAAALAEAAAQAGRPGLAAAAASVAGDRARGLQLALAAVEATSRPGERATLLHLAASCADPPASRELAARAVRELVETGDYLRASELLGDLPDAAGDPLWAGLRGRVHWETGSDQDAVDAYEQAVALAEPDSGDAVRYSLELARAVILGLGDGDRALALATAAAAEAERLGVERARALCVLGTVKHFHGDITGLDDLDAAIALAAQTGETEVEFTAVNNLIASCESMDRTGEACERADRGATRAGELGLQSWQQQLTAMGLNVRFHTGEYDRLLAEAPSMLAGALQRRTRDQVEIVFDLVLVDVGRTDEALQRADAALRQSADDHHGRGNLQWVRAEALLWAGDLEGAADAARAAIEVIPGMDVLLFPQLTLHYAQARSGVPLEQLDPHEAAIPILSAAPDELAGHAALAVGDLVTARQCYARAAELWRGRHRRGELRCRWLAADCADSDEARAELLLLERELGAAGWGPLLGQVRRSLRARGVRSSAPRERSGALTAREREVLDLVAAGHSTAAVARRLGLSSATVAAQIASARTKLGASNRRQAATGS